MRWLHLLFVLLFPFSLNAQLQVFHNGEKIKSIPSTITCSFQEKLDFSFAMYTSIGPQEWEPASKRLIHTGIFDRSVWIRIPLETLIKDHLAEVLEVDNPAINFIHAWILDGDSLVKEFQLTGDHLEFQSRNIPIPSFSFDLPKLDGLKKPLLVLAVDKRFSKLYLPVNFCSRPAFSLHVKQEAYLIGILLGALTLVFLLNLYLFISLRQWAYCWYGLYLLAFLLYACADNGLLFQYLHPSNTQITDFTRPFLLAIGTFPLVLFYNNLLKTKDNFPFYHRTISVLLIIFGVSYLLAMISFAMDKSHLHDKWLLLFSILSPLILLMLITVSWRSVMKKIPLSWYAAFSTTGVSLLMFIYNLHQNELLPVDNFFTQHAQYAGVLTELLIMSAMLVARFYLFKKEADKLQKDYLTQQQQFFQEMSDWQKHEMARMAAYLHDTIGTSLGLIRMEADYMELTEENRQQLSEKIAKLGSDIRTMSHQFSTDILEKNGLKAAIEYGVNKMNEEGQQKLILEWMGNDREVRFNYQLVVFRIVQELLQNVRKHSKANEAHLQIHTENNLIYIYIEDNGKGAKDLDGGIGLKNIQYLVNLLKGSFSVYTAEGRGFSVSIEITQSDHEEISHRHPG